MSEAEGLFHLLSNMLMGSNSTPLTALYLAGANEAVPLCGLYASEWHNDEYANTNPLMRMYSYCIIKKTKKPKSQKQGHEI